MFVDFWAGNMLLSKRFEERIFLIKNGINSKKDFDAMVKL
jgi:hypothetical protein